jgi:anti-sigma regulatory factor (Ser/Thr protein kinase)
VTSDDKTHTNGHRTPPANGPFRRFARRARADAGWDPVDLGDDQVVARLHLEMRPGPQAAREGRHALDRLHSTLDQDDLHAVRLLLTELVSNSVRHGDTSDWIQLDVDIYADTIRVEVHDRGPGFHPRETPQPHSDRPGGWGLCLVDRLADRWGVALDDRTRVWFEIDFGDRDRLAA